MSAIPGAINMEKYGVSVANERMSGGFASVCSALSRVDAGDDPSALWISRQALAKAISSSSSLREMQSELWSSWGYWSQLFPGDEVYGDMAYWALRDAYREAGGYRDASATDLFWQKVSSELEDAFNEGRLEERRGVSISKVAPPIPANGMVTWLDRTLGTCVHLLSMTQLNGRMISDLWSPGTSDSTYKDEELSAREALGGNSILYSNGGEASDSQRAFMRMNMYLGKLGVAIARVALLLSPVALAATLVLKTRRHASGRVELLLIVCGLLLSAFAYEAATVWYVSYQVAAFGYDSYAVEVYKYSPEFMVCAFSALLVIWGSCVSTLFLNSRREGSAGAA